MCFLSGLDHKKGFTLPGTPLELLNLSVLEFADYFKFIQLSYVLGRP